MRSSATIRIYNRLQELTKDNNVSPLVREVANIMVDNNINTSIVYLSHFNGTDAEKEQIVCEFTNAYRDRKKNSTEYVLCIDVESMLKDEFEEMKRIAERYGYHDISMICPYENNNMTNIRGYICLNETGRKVFELAVNVAKNRTWIRYKS